MHFYIRDKKTFAIKVAAIGYDYELFIDSIFDDNSSITIKYDKNIQCGDIITDNNGYYGLITEKEKDEDTLELTCANIINLFDRECIYTSQSIPTVEARLKGMIDEHFKNIQDDYYKYSYINVTVGSSTVSDVVPDLNDGIYNMMEYIGKVRIENNIHLRFSTTGRTLNINIYKKGTTTKNLIFANQPMTIEEETFSDDITSKVTCYDPETPTTTDYYLLTDGSITTNGSSLNRVDGKWQLITVSSTDDTVEKATEVFNNNERSHKIVFSTPKEYARFNFWDRLKLQLNKQIYTSYVASVCVDNDNIVTYQLGELETTLTDKMRRKIGIGSVAKTSSSSASVESITSDEISSMWG